MNNAYRYATMRRIWIAGIAFSAVACAQAPDAVETVQSALVSAPGCGMVPSDSVCACRDPNFSGQCFDFTTSLRFYGNLSTFQGGTFNDSITSLWVGPDAKTTLCTDPGWSVSGGSLCMSTSGPFTNSNLTDGCGIEGSSCCAHGDCPSMWCCQNDKTSSIRVDNASDDCQNPGLSRVAFFTDPNYAGDCVVLFRQIGVHIGWPNATGNATNATQGGGFGLPDNSISSVKVGVPGMGHNFDIYDGANYTGSDFFYGASVPDLTSFGFNDRTSAIQTVN